MSIINPRATKRFKQRGYKIMVSKLTPMDVQEINSTTESQFHHLQSLIFRLKKEGKIK